MTSIPQTIKLGCFYIIGMKLGTKLLFATPIVLLIMAAAPTAKAWDYGPGNWGGPGGGDYDGIGLGHLITGLGQNFGLWGGQEGGGWYHQAAYQNGYYAGTQDAIYDHQNNLVYTDQPGCLSCHSQLYLDGFRNGYSQQWNSYQNQESTQGTSINIYGNNNYVNTNQYSGQNQQGSELNPNSDFNPPNCWGSCNGGP